LVGDPFDLQDYGFALQLGSPLRKELNAALLKLQVSGWTDELEDKWFETPAAGP
jgi:ABC-type amino acid transport substrate-binding protein